MKEIIIETESMVRFNSTADTVLEAGRLASGFVLAYGRAGRGKSVAANRYFYERGGAYVRVWQNLSQTAFLQKLLFEVRGKNMGMPKHNAMKCKEKICEILAEERKPLFIDEADRLHIDRLEDLRDIFEETQAPVILIGEEGIWGLLETRRRIMSRIAYEVEFLPISATEVAIFAMQAANLNITPEDCLHIARKCEGDFRLVRNIILQLEQSAKATENYTVEKEALNQAMTSLIRNKRG